MSPLLTTHTRTLRVSLLSYVETPTLNLPLYKDVFYSFLKDCLDQFLPYPMRHFITTVSFRFIRSRPLFLSLLSTYRFSNKIYRGRGTSDYRLFIENTQRQDRVLCYLLFFFRGPTSSQVTTPECEG